MILKYEQFKQGIEKMTGIDFFRKGNEINGKCNLVKETG